MSAPPTNQSPGYGKLAERHHRRGVTTTPTTGTDTRPNNSARRRGLPQDFEREAAEQEYQARYEKQLQERRQQRATERRDIRKKEILSGRVEKRPRQKQVSEATVRWIKYGVLALLTMILLVSVVMAYDKLTGSRLFILKNIDLQGTKQVSRDEVMHLLEPYKSRSLWQLDLKAIRAAVEKNPWVQDAEVARVLPDALRVTIQERRPVAPWRTPNGAVVWVDRDGRSLGELSTNKADQIPPIISGLEEGTADEIKVLNRQRMEAYQKLLTELDQSSGKLAEEIDEIKLNDLQAVRLHLLKRHVNVMLGGTDFRVRIERAIKVLEAIERKDLSALGLLKVSDAEKLVSGKRIAYLNVMHPEHVVVGFE